MLLQWDGREKLGDSPASRYYSNSREMLRLRECSRPSQNFSVQQFNMNLPPATSLAGLHEDCPSMVIISVPIVRHTYYSTGPFVDFSHVANGNS